MTVSVSVRPYESLSVAFAEKPLPEGTVVTNETVAPSDGVTGFGE